MVKLKQQQFNSLQTSHFKALFIKDIISTVQGHYTMFVLRLMLPSILLLILYILTHGQAKPDITGIPKSISASNMTLPQCYALGGDNSPGGLGAKEKVDECILVAYYPKNEITSKIMDTTMRTLNNINYIGYDSIEDFQKQKIKLFSVEFQADFSPNQQIDQIIKRLSIVIQYNQSYVDMPNFYSIYGDEKFADAQPYNNIFGYASWSSFPLAIQSHVLKAIMKNYDIDYDPVFRANVVQARNRPILETQAISTVLFGLIFALQSIFVVIQIQQDKQGQLDSIRLSGVTDIIYLAEIFTFQMLCYVLMAFFQYYTAFWLPGGNDVFYGMNKPAYILIVAVGGVYSTCLGIFIGILTKPKASVLILIFASFIIILLCYQMFGVYMIYDTSVLPSFVLFLIRWLFPFACIGSSTTTIVFPNINFAVFDDKTFSYVKEKQFQQYNMKNFTTSVESYGTFNYNIKFTMPSNAYMLLLSFIQAVLMFFFGWILGEWLPGNASASRPFWKLFKKQTDTQGFTHGQMLENNIQVFKNQIQNKTRQKLSQDQVIKCFQEATQKCDPLVVDIATKIMTNEYSNDEVLITHHIHKQFKRSAFGKQSLMQGKTHQAVQSVNFCVHKGEIFGLAGHNGAGKSTTLNIITGAVKVDKKGYRIFKNNKFTEENINNAWLCNQYSIRNDIVQVRRQLAYCPQFNTNLYGELTIYQNLKFMCKIQNIPYYDHHRTIICILKKMNLENWKDKKIQQLSGGMQRRVSIAMTLVNSQTKLIIMDEPSTGLDPQTKRVIWANVKDVARSSRKIPVVTGSSIQGAKIHRVRADKPGVIITSHDMNELDTLCDSIQIMSEGLIVAQGTSLELKQKYGSGYTLTIMGKSKRKIHSFKTMFDQFLISSNAQHFVKEIDNSGSVSIYSVSQEYSESIGKLIRYLEHYVLSDTDIQDYCFERTSMDEVFVNVGNKFKVANGAEIDVTQLKDLDTIMQDGIKTVEYTSDESIDIETNQKNWPSTNSKQDIQKILSPERQKPNISIALLLKMAKKDQIQRFGIFSYVCLPFVVLLVAYIICNLLLDSVVQSVNNQINDQIEQFSQICTGCQTLSVADIPIGQCKGFDSWGFPGLCEQANILQKKLYQPNVTWYGGDQRIWPDNTNLYQLQEEQSRVLVFDKNLLMGKSNNGLIGSSLKGYQVIQSVKYGTFTLRKTSYEYYNEQGQPTNNQIQDQLQQQLRLITQSSDILDKFDIKPIAIQQRQSDNQEINSFRLKNDFKLENGYEYYDSAHEFDITTQKKLNLQRYVYSNQKVNHNKDCSALIEDYNSLNDEQQLEQMNEFLKNNTACVKMDDKYALQDLNQQIAQQIPLGFIDLDSQNITAIDKINKFQPVMSAFAPARQVFFYNDVYKIMYKWVNSNNYNQLVQQVPQLEQLREVNASMRRVPSGAPSVIYANWLTQQAFSPQTSLIDLSTRLGTSVMRKLLNQEVNIRFGVQMFPGVQLNAVNVLQTQMSLILITTLQVVATWCIIFKFGAHVVKDRETGFRRQLYLNGVGRSHYFLTQIYFTILVGIAVQLVIYILGRWIFSLQTFVRIDAGTYFILALAAVISTVSVSVFLSSFVTKSSVYNLIGILVLLVTIVTIMLNMQAIGDSPPWYSYIFPSISYSMLILKTSYYGTLPSELFNSSLGPLLLVLIFSSIIFLILGVLLDFFLPVNGFKSFSALKQQQIPSENDKIPGGFGVGIGEDLKSNRTDTNISIENEGQRVKYGHQQLNKFDKSQFNVKSKRDKAAFDQMDRMDVDVFRERQLLQNGVMKNTPVVVANISKKFNDFLAIRDISFHIPQSEHGCVFALLGPNGAAKTTTINLMTGLMQSDSGSVFLHGFDMNDQKQAEQAYKHIGLCSQFDVYLTELSVRDHLMLFAALHGVKWAEIDLIVQKLAGFVCLGEVLDKSVGQLSGGMRRRLSLALAIIG
ncbi:ABC_transporter family protein [Hexamita inflata]|uniref:ABC transporter family protein n=1 Tax=Hexamita inflata TaxID=28002 RepID=A0AA86UAS3_9EUKA|nr:ABC transporter family protein [Hexamita inflata]